MADIKSALRKIPEMQTGEEPANEGQKGYLRSFGYFSEKLIKGLGALQAAYLADQADLIKQEGSANIDIYQRKPRKLGRFLGIIFLLGVIVLLLFKGRDFLQSKDEGLADPAGHQSEVSDPEVLKRDEERKASKNVEPESQVNPVPEAPGKTLDLASVQYPAIVVVTDPFGLLNSAGKETPVLTCQTIRRDSRYYLPDN